ncbi:crAss001_48 related protein [Lapidilactobacillus gannanensis]|uniref:Uncharacterized protein n=1 Tax=Lapidilactobacillus gannanensis TaxID=2486002 RepID=A0ABW4BKJ2_9LACO|nr:hypothetical protein [Lapidilactobacillus gannanensis]
MKTNEELIKKLNNELGELNDKLNRLNSYWMSQTAMEKSFRDCSQLQLDLLAAQSSSMRSYAYILRSRISDLLGEYNEN